MILFKKRPLILFIFLMVIFIVFAGSSYSSDISHPSTPSISDENTKSSHETGHSTDRHADHMDLLFRFMSFTVLAVIIVIVFRKARILEYFSVRSEEIRKRLEDLKRDRDEVERRYKEAEEKLKNIEENSRDIIEQYRKDGMAEKERIISAAKERVKQIIDQAEITIQREIESARRGLKEEIIELASQKAKGILSREIGEKEQENMVDDFIVKMGRK
jgi:F-type H+-transporting ATPase subunit b